MTFVQSLHGVLVDRSSVCLSSDDANGRIKTLDLAKSATVLTVLKSKERGKPSFMQIEADFSDLCDFYLALNAAAGCDIVNDCRVLEVEDFGARANVVTMAESFLRYVDAKFIENEAAV